MPSNLTVATAIALLQWLSIQISIKLFPLLHPNTPMVIDFDPTAILAGNLQIVVVLWMYQVITKYIKF